MGGKIGVRRSRNAIGHFFDHYAALQHSTKSALVSSPVQRVRRSDDPAAAARHAKRAYMGWIWRRRNASAGQSPAIIRNGVRYYTTKDQPAGSRWSHFLRRTGGHPDQVRGRLSPDN